jgi:chitin disaccharide deacetylase
MKQIIINADDYAYSESIDAAILDLAEKNVVTATTALVCSPRWPKAAKLLRDAPLSAGLHLDFTNGFAPTNHSVDLPVKQLIVKAWSRSLDRTAAAQSVNEQLDKFEQAMGRAPATVDGHEHCHQFAVIRDVLLEALQDRYAKLETKPLLRNTAPHAWRGTKAAIIGALGSSSLKRLAQQAGFAMSGDFAGVYDFASHSDLSTLWQQWFSSLQADTGKMMIMCHPGYEGKASDTQDSIYASRVKEAAFLSSEAFAQLCKAHQVQLVRA